MPPFDNSLMFRTTGNLTATGTTVALKVKHTGVLRSVKVVIPQGDGVDTLIADVEVDETDVNANYVIASRYPDSPKVIPAAGEVWYIPFTSSKKYARIRWTVAGTSPNFGVVEAGLVVGVPDSWSRAVDWS